MTDRRLRNIALAVLLLLAFALRCGLAVAFPNIDRPDEIYQTIEPAHRLVTGWGVVTWEWREGIRSWLFPGFLAVPIAVSEWLGFGRAGYFPAIDAMLSLLSAGTVAVAFAFGWRHSKLAGALLCAVPTLFWPDLLYFGSKTLPEVQAGNLLVIAVGLAALQPKRPTPRALAGLGLLLGLVFCLRIQLAPALLVVAGWSARAELRRWKWLLAGALLPIAALGLSDWMAWGTPFQSVWKYVLVNLVQGRAETYGTHPVGWYFATLAGLWGGAILPFALLFAVGARRAQLPALAAAVIVLSHSAVAHKEIGFIFAALPLAIITAGIGASEIVRLAGERMRLRPGLASALALAAMLWLGAAVTAHGRYRDAFTNASDYLQAMQAVHALTDLCGLGLWYPGWASYASIDRPVPMYLMTTPAQFTEAAPQFNYLLVAEGSPPASPQFSVDRCWNAICLLKAQRACTASGTDEINAALRDRGL